MIKIMFCLRRLPALSQEAFHRYWLETHAPLVRQHAATLRIRRYVQSHTFTNALIAPALDARGSVLEPFDGVAELWWDSIEDVVAVGNTREGRAAGRTLIEDERNFIDLAQSSLFYTVEYEIVAPPA
jgi:uncharacterized protein (TIGR02118 family)